MSLSTTRSPLVLTVPLILSVLGWHVPRPVRAALPDIGGPRGEMRVSTEDTDQLAPAWSPEGDRLAFTQRNQAGSTTFNILVRDLSSSEAPRAITKDSDNVSGFSPLIWSSDGRFVGFLTTDGFYKTASAAGTGISTSTPIGQTCLRGNAGSVALHGRYFLVNLRGRNITLLELRPDGAFRSPNPTADPVFLTNFDSLTEIGDLRISADHRKVLFSVRTDARSSRLYVLNAVDKLVSGAQSPPTSLSSSLITSLGSISDYDSIGDFSADGSFVLISSGPGFATAQDCTPNSQDANLLIPAQAGFDLMALATDGSGESATLTGLNRPGSGRGSNELFPALSPGGARLAFVRDANLVFQMLTADLLYQKRIPSTGGDRTAGDGTGTTVTLPEGALATATTIEISRPTSIPNPGAVPPGVAPPIVAAREILSTGGSTFTTPVTVTLGYLPSEVTDLDPRTLAAFRFDTASGTWNELMGGTVDTTSRRVTFQTTRFSTFGLASIPSPTSGGGAAGGGLAPPPSSGGGGGGGGCASAPGPSGTGDPLLPLMLLLPAVAYFSRQRRLG